MRPGSVANHDSLIGIPTDDAHNKPFGATTQFARHVDKVSMAFDFAVILQKRTNAVLNTSYWLPVPQRHEIVPHHTPTLVSGHTGLDSFSFAPWLEVQYLEY